jgi:hypothetical protein
MAQCEVASFCETIRERCSSAGRTEVCSKSVYIAILPKLTAKLFEVLAAVVHLDTTSVSISTVLWKGINCRLLRYFPFGYYM